MRHHVVIYSGGMDSYTLLHWLMKRGSVSPDAIHALSFDYGQRHAKELTFAHAECLRLGIHHEIIDLRSLHRVLLGSSLTTPSIPVPHGHYEAESMKATVVPGRNTIMLSIAMAYAEGMIMRAEAHQTATERERTIQNYLTRAGRFATVSYAAHAGDHYIYPDCRPGYIDAMISMMGRATDSKIDLIAPFAFMDKGEIAREGLQMGLDYSRAWTCYEGGDRPCGQCGACQERAEAFAKAGTADPLLR